MSDLEDLVRDAVTRAVAYSVWSPLWYSVNNSVTKSVINSVRRSVYNSVRRPIWNSVKGFVVSVRNKTEEVISDE